MARKRKCQWDTETQLTKEECAILRRAVRKVVERVYAREKNKTKRSLLVFSGIPGEISWSTARENMMVAIEYDKKEESEKKAKSRK